jgi:hypothetical protein
VTFVDNEHLIILPEGFELQALLKSAHRVNARMGGCVYLLQVTLQMLADDPGKGRFTHPRWARKEKRVRDMPAAQYLIQAFDYGCLASDIVQRIGPVLYV